MQQTNLPERVTYVIIFYGLGSFVCFLDALKDPFIHKVHPISILTLSKYLVVFLYFFPLHFLDEFAYFLLRKIVKQEAAHAEEKNPHVGILFLRLPIFDLDGAPTGFLRGEPVPLPPSPHELVVPDLPELLVVNGLESAALVPVIGAVGFKVVGFDALAIPEPFRAVFQDILWLRFNNVSDKDRVHGLHILVEVLHCLLVCLLLAFGVCCRGLLFVLCFHKILYLFFSIDLIIYNMNYALFLY